MRARAMHRTYLAVLLALALVLSACGDDDTTDDGSAAGPDDGATTTAPADPEAEGDPVPGGTIRYGAYADATGFDPAGRAGAGHHLWPIYDTLVRLDDEGEPQPFLAESIESEDLQTWTMTLREGVQFHDGTPLDAEAVVFNINRHKDPANASPAAAELGPVQSVEAVDELTVEFSLEYPVAAFPVVFIGQAGMIASPTAVEASGEDYAMNPVGAGPFEFVEWLPDERAVYTKNENYWQEGLPYADELVILPRPDTETRQESVLTGDVDAAWQITVAEIREAQDNDAVDVYLRQGNGAEGILMQVTRPPFDDIRMRQMMAHSLNYDVISDVRFGGDMQRAYSPIGPDSPFYRDTSDIYPDYDPEAAKALIDEYVADGGDPNFTFAAPNTPDRIIFGEMVQQFWADLGLNVELEFLDITEYVERVLYAADFQAAINTMPAFPHPYPNLFNNLISESPTNFGRYASEEMDELLVTARSSTDEQERIEAWQEVQTLLAEDLPWAWYARNATALIVQPTLHGVFFAPNGVPYFNEAWIES